MFDLARNVGGYDVRVGGFVRNDGTADSGPFWIEFWACPGDPDYPWLYSFCADSILVGNLAVGETFDLSTHQLDLYRDIPPGQGHMVAVPADSPDLRRHWHRGCWVNRHDRR